MITRFDAADAIVLKLASIVCLQMMGRTSDELERFADETPTEIQPTETVMAKLGRLRVAHRNPFRIGCSGGNYEIEYSDNIEHGVHILCAALLKRLFEVLGMPIPQDDNRWEDGNPITTEEMTSINELAATIHIEPEPPIIH